MSDDTVTTYVITEPASCETLWTQLFWAFIEESPTKLSARPQQGDASTNGASVDFTVDVFEAHFDGPPYAFDARLRLTSKQQAAIQIIVPAEGEGIATFTVFS